MEDSIIVVCMFGFIVGWALNTMYRQYQDEKLFKVIIEKIEEEELITDVTTRLPICYVEKHGTEDYLLYEKVNHTFMCQGKSYQELAEQCSEKYDMVLVKGEDESMWFVDGKVKELTSE